MEHSGTVTPQIDLVEREDGSLQHLHPNHSSAKILRKRGRNCFAEEETTDGLPPGVPLCHGGCELIFLDWRDCEIDNASLPDLALQIFGDESYNGKFRALNHVRIGEIEDGVIEEILFNMPNCEDGITTIMIPQYYSVDYLYDILKDKNLREFLEKKGLSGDGLDEKLQCIRRNLAVIAFQPNYRFITKDSAKVAINIALSENGSDWRGTRGEAPLEEGEFVTKMTFRGDWGRCERAVFPDLVENLEAVTYIRQIFRRFHDQPQYCSQHGVKKIGIINGTGISQMVLDDKEPKSLQELQPTETQCEISDEIPRKRRRQMEQNCHSQIEPASGDIDFFPQGASLCRSGCNLIFLNWQEDEELDNLPRLAFQVFGRESYNGKFDSLEDVCDGGIENGEIEEMLFNMTTCEDGITTILIPMFYSVDYLYETLKEKNLREFLEKKGLFGRRLDKKLRYIRKNLAVIAYQPYYTSITKDSAQVVVNIAISNDGSDWKGEDGTEAPLEQGERVKKYTFKGKWSTCSHATLSDLVENAEAVTFIRKVIRRYGRARYCSDH